jgi:hypothetical protein
LFNKAVHFKEIFEIMFEFKLAFVDEIRPYLAQDDAGGDLYGEFDKYKLLMRDKKGRLYWNTDFIFGTDGSFGLPKDPMFLYEQTIALFQAQAIDVTQLWTILESLQFPNASKIKKQWQEKMNQQAQMEQMGQALEQAQTENQQLTEQLQQIMQELQKEQEANIQGEAEIIKQQQEAEKRKFDEQERISKFQDQQALNEAKLQLEAEKLAAAREKAV